MGYNGYTEKKKASNKKYMDGLSRCVIWLKEEEKKEIETRAKAAGKSMNQYLKDVALSDKTDK